MTRDTNLLRLDNRFWQFSLRVYRVPEAAKECLELQRLHAINVNMLLLCAWIAVSRRIALSTAEVRLIASTIQQWHSIAVLPIRNVREQLKSASEMQHREVQAFRMQVLATELRAEQIEQALLFEEAERLPPRCDDGNVRDIIAENVSKLMETNDVSGSISALISASLTAGQVD